MPRGFIAIGLLAWVVGCGRVGYDGSGAEPAIDAARLDVLGCDPNAGIDALIARYPLDGDATDTVNGADGVERAAISYGPGRIGDAVVLDGVSSLIELPVVAIPEFSVTFWVNTTDVGSGTANDLWFAGLGMVDGEVCGSPPGSDWGISLISGGHVAYSSSGQSPVEINDGQWHMIAAWTEVSGDGAGFIDGHLVVTGISAPDQNYSSVPFVGVGNDPCGASGNRDFFAGSIDDIRFYDRRLTDSEIADLAACPAP